MQSIKTVILLFIAVVFRNTLFASPEIVLSSEKETFHFLHYIKSYKDTTNSLTIDSIKEKSDCFSLGLPPKEIFSSKHTIWYQFTLENKNTNDKNFVLSIGNAHIQHIHLYKYQNGIIDTLCISDIAAQNKNKNGVDNFFECQLQINKQSQATFYLSICNNGDQVIVPMSLFTNAEHEQKQSNYILFSGFFFGVLFLLLFIIVAQYYSMRDRLYLISLGYLCIVIVRYIIYDRVLFDLWPQIFKAHESYMMLISVNLAIIFSFELIKNIVLIRKNSIVLNRIIGAYQFLGLILLDVVFWETPIAATSVQLSIAIFLIFIITIHAVLQRNKNVIYLLFIIFFGTASFYFIEISAAEISNYTSISITKLSELFTSLIFFAAITRRLERKKIDLSKIIRHRTNQINDQKVELERKNEELQKKILDYENSEKARIDLQEQLVQSQKMETIGRMAGSIAHDFNNILTPIIGHTDLAMEMLPEDSEIRDDLELVIKASFRAKDLINQILTFSRDLKEESVNVDIDLIITDVLKLIKPSLSNKIEARFIHDDQPAIIKATPTRIEQVIMNVCKNANDAMGELGGELVIIRYLKKIGDNDFATLSAGMYVCVEIKDSGQGISDQIQSKIFDPFFTTKKPGKGTGLGLAVVHGIVKNAGGEIFVKSKVGEGTNFTIFFPASATIKTAILPEVYFEQIRGTETILLVDDEEVITTMLRQQLSKIGFRVVVFNNGKNALSEFAANPTKYDLLITDQRMPGMSGDELVKAARTINDKLKIIMITGYSEKVDATVAKEIGISEFILKPFDPKSFAQTIRKVLDS